MCGSAFLPVGISRKRMALVPSARLWADRSPVASQAHRGTLHESQRWGGDQAAVPAVLEHWRSLPVLNNNTHFALECKVLSRINSFGNEFRGKYLLFGPFY